MKLVFLLIATLGLFSCSNQNLDDYDALSPELDVKTFFNGKLQAKGIVLDRTGTVTRRFSVDMLGTWQGNVGKLEEWFVFDDGERSQRTWIITQLQDGLYTGTADDIEGVAQGESAGFALHWDYELNLVVDDSEYLVRFDDWLYQIDEKVVINRSYIKKWGSRLAKSF